MKHPIIFILLIIAANFIVFLLIIRPFMKYSDRINSDMQQKHNLKEFCAHHEIKDDDITEFNQFFDDMNRDLNKPGCKRLLFLIITILLIILSFIIF